jgi:YHS domain-containing protein
MCPVLQDRAATSDYAITYKGKEVRFCCSECVMEFQNNPTIYENAVPQLQDLPLRHQIQLFLGDYGGMVVAGFLLVTLIGLRLYRWKHPATPAEPATGVAGRVMSLKISPVIPLLLLAGYLGYEVYSLQHQLHLQQLEDEIHFATFYDFGYPPVPRRAESEKRVSASFYRGNDERSPKLFNEGNYRTATFHVSLCDQEGNPVDTGDTLPDDDLFVKLVIERPPFTPDFLYNPQMMNAMFLTTECDRFLEADGPVKDRVMLTETEPMQEWEALYPVNLPPACCRKTESDSDCENYRGTIYVCQEYFTDPAFKFMEKQRGGSRFHYGICYDLKVSGGTLAEESDVYMGALYRTRKLPTWRVPMDQWFSHNPIPELPSAGPTDPELLGITDHVAGKTSGFRLAK